MDAIARIEDYLSKHPTAPAAQVLAQLAVALDHGDSFDLGALYALDYEAFEMALALLAEWRIDRFFAHDTGLLDRVIAAARPPQRDEQPLPA